MLDDMSKRFVAIWFRHLKTDWMIRKKTGLKEIAFVLAAPDHGRMRITEVSAVAKVKGLYAGMIVADARVILPDVKVLDDNPNLNEKLLSKLCTWCIRYTPIATIDLPNGLILDVSGCAHLWGSEENYLKDIINKLKSLGYHVRAAMADTIGAAWAISRYGKIKAIIRPNEQVEALKTLTPAALRLDRLQKLGLHTIGGFINMQRSALRRRFGQQLLSRLDEAIGNKEEIIQPIIPVEPYSERLPCHEPIQTAKGIEIAIQKLLDELCKRLRKEGKGLRNAIFKCLRIDDKIEQINININHASNNPKHLFKLFELKIATIEPALGIELFTLEASNVEDVVIVQQTFWTANSSFDSIEVAELLNNIESKFGNNIIHRYLPDEHHLPEHSIKLATSLKDKPGIEWNTNKLRPIHLLNEPEPIEVTAPIRDYQPMNFRYKNKFHKVTKADACERIEAEWWLNPGLHRDYYIVEDDEGKRYWLFRLGHYTADKTPSWFIHGFFA